jgi:hypothetical protein
VGRGRSGTPIAGDDYCFLGCFAAVLSTLLLLLVALLLLVVLFVFQLLYLQWLLRLLVQAS